MLSLAGEPDPVAAYARQLVRIGAALDLAVPADEPATALSRLAAEFAQSPLARLWVVDGVPDGLRRDELALLVAPHPLAATLVTTGAAGYGPATRRVQGPADALLNDVLRPFLSHWHPRLSAHEARRPAVRQRTWADREPVRLTAAAGRATALLSGLGERPNVARLVAMLTEQMSLAEVKNRLSEVVEAVEREHGRLVITKHGRPAAIVVSVDDLEGLEETLDVMGDTGLLHDIREALVERPDSEPIVLSRDEALRLAANE